MAQDSDAPNISNAEIDIDDLEVEIYILCKNPGSLKATCAFLTRRGWPTQAVGNVSTAIEYIAEHRPDFVLISFSHQSPAVVKLPELITQTFKLECIGFVEGSDPLGAQKLMNSRVLHKASGQPSGPNFHRIIRRLLQERFSVANDNSKLANSSGSAEMAIQNMYSGNAENSAPTTGGIIVQKGNGGVGAGALITSGNSAGGEGDGPSTNMGAGGIVQSGANASPSSSDVVSSGKYTMGKSRHTSLKELSKRGRGVASGAGVTFGEAGGDGSGTVTEENTADLVSRIKKSLFGDTGEGPAIAVLKAPETPVNSAVQEVEPTTDTVAVSIEAAVSASPENILKRAVNSALKSLCLEHEDQPLTKLSTVSRVAVFPIDSHGLPGYLVLALERLPESERSAFFSRASQALKNAFVAMGVPGTLEPGFWVDVPSSAFLPWVESSGRFHFVMSHEGVELGVAFFHAGNPIPKARDADKGMHTIGLDDIATGHPVTFKAYLHMERNQKFFLYLRNGRELQPEQKERLRSGDVKELYMKSVDVENLRLFLASAFLHGSIKKPGSDAA